ncbi:MAG: hypothetical protein MZV63_47635 [Marinilabiliales bacterium]|nr:hypothetical protein [Marinilabiliales bacterium]
MKWAASLIRSAAAVDSVTGGREVRELISNRKVLISFHVTGQGRVTPLVGYEQRRLLHCTRHLASLCEQSGAAGDGYQGAGRNQDIYSHIRQGQQADAGIHGTHLRHYNHLNIGEPCLSCTRQQERRIRHTPSAGVSPLLSMPPERMPTMFMFCSGTCPDSCRSFH